MNIDTYYKKLNHRSQKIFASSLKKPGLLGKVHSTASDMHQLSNCISNVEEAAMIHVVCSQLETSCLALSYGLYRPALASLRLAFEFGIAAVFFSSNKLAHHEWILGIQDLKWSTINSQESGVLSTRFAKAFFPQLESVVGDYQVRANMAYRRLSEYVHGNNETWQTSGIILAENDKIITLYSEQLDEIGEILKFAFCCRYLEGLTPTELDEAHPVLADTLMHISPIRAIFGGPKDIK